jgi:hypothetical protein
MYVKADDPERRIKIKIMPIKRCQKDKKKGFKFGDTGKCFTGKSAKEKAEKQGRAIKAEEARRKKKK